MYEFPFKCYAQKKMLQRTIEINSTVKIELDS